MSDTAPRRRFPRIVRSPLAPAVAALLLAPLLSIPAPAAPAEGIPSLEKAVESEIHGPARLRKRNIQIQYDFRKPDQALDFALDRLRGITFGPIAGANPSAEVENPRIEPGRLLLPPSAWAHALLPLAEVQTVSVTARGVDGLSIRLRGGKDQVTVNFAENPSISFDEGLGIGDSKRNLKLLPGDNYQFSVEIRGGKVIGKLDGKLLVEKELPKEFGALGEIRFGPSILSAPSTEDVQVSAVIIAGVVSEHLPLIAANRGRAAEKHPPLWEKTSTGTGKHITVTSPGAADVAEDFARRLDGIVLRLLADYPLTAAKEGAGGGAEPPPADRRAPPFEYARTVHLFEHADVLRAYSGSALPLVELPSGDIALLDRKDDGEEARIWSIQWMIAGQTIDRFYAASPWWWSAGNCAVAALDAGRDPADPNVHAGYVAKARAHLGKGIEPRLSDIVRGWTPSQGGNAPIEVAWAWMHFLRHGDGGAHRGLLMRYHEELRLGRSGPEASTLVFPTEVFDRLYGKFQAYLGTLVPAG